MAEGAAFTVAVMQKNDRVRATNGENVLVGRAVGFAGGALGAPIVYLNPDGEIRGFSLDDSWTFELLERKAKP